MGAIVVEVELTKYKSAVDANRDKSKSITQGSNRTDERLWVRSGAGDGIVDGDGSAMEMVMVMVMVMMMVNVLAMVMVKAMVMVMVNGDGDGDGMTSTC